MTKDQTSPLSDRERIERAVQRLVELRATDALRRILAEAERLSKRRAEEPER